MKRKSIFTITLMAITFLAFAFKTIINEPWTEKQLMPPAELAKIINEGGKSPIYIYSIGPSGLIKNAIDIGETNDSKNLKKFKKEVSKLPLDANIVIYCGCCPFGDCPNIRPSFSLLKEMKFTNHKLLYLPQNLKADWIDKGYPMNN